MVSCGLRSYLAYRILSQNGFDCRNIDGGYDLYRFIDNEKKAQLNDKENRKDIDFLEEVALSTEADEKQVKNNIEKPSNANKTIKVDACGMQCPGPIRRVYEEIENLNDGDILEVKASDSGFKRDIKSWCESTGNELLESSFSKTEKCFNVKIKKNTENLKKKN